MNIFKKFINLFKHKDVVDVNKIVDSNNASSIKNIGDERILKIKNSDCGLLLHEDGEIEILFIKNEGEEQTISDQEESLMALALFIKQQGFLDLLLSEFRKVARVDMSAFQSEDNKNDRKNNR